IPLQEITFNDSEETLMIFNFLVMRFIPSHSCYSEVSSIWSLLCCSVFLLNVSIYLLAITLKCSGFALLSNRSASFPVLTVNISFMSVFVEPV
uniref:Uncharacterized protein n=1 Tax=Poecilia reticulata TaxID=8081 RepID=A0A3P9N569_POERE